MSGTGGSTGGEKLVGADRVIAVLTELAAHPQGVTLDELAGILSSSKPTVHRALATLRRAGLADLVERGVYVLGDEYLRLAFRNLDGRPETARIQPVLEELATTFGETAHYAVLAGPDIVYRAKMDPPSGAVRLTSVIGGRNPAHSTAVGRVLLSSRLRTRAEVTRWFGDARPPDVDALVAELEATRGRGYGIDDQENEAGVNCVAIPVHLDAAPEPSGAVSVSAVSFRTPMADLREAVPAIREVIARHLGGHGV